MTITAKLVKEFKSATQAAKDTAGLNADKSAVATPTALTAFSKVHKLTVEDIDDLLDKAYGKKAEGTANREKSDNRVWLHPDVSSQFTNIVKTADTYREKRRTAKVSVNYSTQLKSVAAVVRKSGKLPTAKWMGEAIAKAKADGSGTPATIDQRMAKMKKGEDILLAFEGLLTAAKEHLTGNIADLEAAIATLTVKPKDEKPSGAAAPAPDADIGSLLGGLNLEPSQQEALAALVALVKK